MMEILQCIVVGLQPQVTFNLKVTQPVQSPLLRVKAKLKAWWSLECLNLLPTGKG